MENTLRINLNIDDDVLLAVKEIAQRRECSTGRARSALVRQVLAGQNEPRLCNRPANTPARRRESTHHRPTLSHTDAMKVVDAIRAELEKTGAAPPSPWPTRTANCSPSCAPTAASFPRSYIAINKAFTAAREGIESYDLGQALQSRTAFR